MIRNIKLAGMGLLMLSLTIPAHSNDASSKNSVSVSVQDGKALKGVVKDVNGEPIVGVYVLVKGTTNGTMTDFDGNFNISGIKKGDVLVVSCVGFENKEITIGDLSQNLSLVLEEAKQVLDEVVVLAYGGRQLRSKVTNSIGKVSNETLSSGLFSNPAQALSGAVSGVRVIQTSGNPGATPTIILRGGTDYDGSGSPLVVIDGQVRGSLSDINPDDIESMEIMKDAGATAIYGARANNGVLLITTKRGKQGTGQINIKAKVGVNFANLPFNFMNARDYLYYMRKAYMNSSNIWQDSNGRWRGITNMSSLAGATPYGTGNKYFAADGITPLDGNKDARAVYSTMPYDPKYDFLLKQGWEVMDDPVNPDQKIIFKNSDPAKFNINNPSLSQDYSINFSGGNDKGSYYAGLGYNKSNGVVVGNWYKRLTFTFNADYKIKPWLKSESSFNFADATWYGLPPTQGSEANYFGRILSLPPTKRDYNADNEMLLGLNASDGNQRFNLDKFRRDNNTDKFTMVQAFTFDITKELKFKVSGNWLYSEGVYESFDKDYLRAPGNYERSRRSSASFDRTLNQTYNAVLTYDTLFAGLHGISSMFGVEYFDSYSKGFSAAGSGAENDDFADLALTSSKENKREIDSYHSRQRIMSFFGRLNYDYSGKYLVSLVMREDGYSRLAKDNRWGFFPGISAGWIFSKEEFMKSCQNILSFGKFRMSYGINGNVNPSWIGPYTVQGSYSSLKYNGTTGYLVRDLPTPYLIWEKSGTFETGFDLGFFDNRLNLNLTYYDRLTSHKFANISLSGSSGRTSIVSNNGSLRNRGVEIELGAKILNTKDWKWNANLNMAYNVNKIVSLPDNGLERNRQNAFQVYSGNGQDKIWVGGYQEGQTPGDIYAYKAEGIYKSYDEIPKNLIDKSIGNNGSNNKTLYGPDAWAALSDEEKSKGLPVQPGDVRWKDVNGDGIIDQFDQVKIGNSVPKWTGGFNTSLSWKQLTFSARFDFGLGFKIVDYRTPWIMGNMQGTYNTIEDTKKTWSKDNPGGIYPIYTWADQLGKRNYARTTSMFIYNGNYLAFRELSLVYRLPSRISKIMGLHGMDFSVTGQNLGYLTEGEHVFSPETSSHNGGYPLPRTIIFGLNVSF